MPITIDSIVLPLTLTRLSDTGHETYGQLADAENADICKTLELPWEGNAKDVSCIPAGIYPLRRRWSFKHNCQVFGIDDVPNRDNIEMHVANFSSQLEGCVALGTTFDNFNKVGGDVSHSQDAFDLFMDLMKYTNETTITILPAPEEAHT